MDPAIYRVLNDKIYERRKVAALDLEKFVSASDDARVAAIIDQLVGMLASNSPLHTRNGGLIGLAATAIALGPDIGPFLELILPPVMACFSDPESRLRYHACESLYNIAKVSKGEILVYFNEIFDALSKLSSDAEMSVKNGAELLDRLMKDIVAEAAPNYVSIYTGSRNPNLPDPHGGHEKDRGAGENGEAPTSPDTRAGANGEHEHEDRRAFSLERFIPLLSERIWVISPYTRMHLVSWLMVLDSVPDLDLVAWLPEFLEGLLKYLADNNVDVRLATENVLAEFLREIKYIAQLQARQEEKRKQQRTVERRSSKYTLESAIEEDNDEAVADESLATDSRYGDDAGEGEHEWEGEGSGAWVPGQGVYVDHAAIMEIMIHHLRFEDELVQSTAMEWILAFLEFAQTTVVAFTPQIVDDVLPNLASPHPHIKIAAHETNSSLYGVIKDLPLQVQPLPLPSTASTAIPIPQSTIPAPPTSTLSSLASSPPGALTISGISPGPLKKDFAIPDGGNPPDSARSPSVAPVSDPLDVTPQPPPPQAQHQQSQSLSLPQSQAQAQQGAGGKGHGIIQNLSVTSLPGHRARGSSTSGAVLGTGTEPATPSTADFRGGAGQGPGVGQGAAGRGRPDSPGAGGKDSGVAAGAGPGTGLSAAWQPPLSPRTEHHPLEDADPFDVRETVNILTLKFLSDHAETRIAALEWLLMLHQKAPDKILSRDDGTFPALLKTLSDNSEDVVKHDLQLLAQISASSEDSYFISFMAQVLDLFSTDRRLLETRGSLIIRQLCLHLNAERIFRTIAELLEKDDDLEFASTMVVKLNMILITSPELSDFRRRLKNLESRDGQMLFSALYRSWCHNAVAAFALCLLAQAYEHASNLLHIFADLELTVPLLVQIDKLVMLIESPVFTNLRLQLLEPDKYPFLPKCLYGLLMILPQSTAFISLRARLQVVHSSGYVPTTVKPTTSSTPFGSARSKLGKEEVKWQELLAHFRKVQDRHEKARRQLHSTDIASINSAHYPSPSQNYTSGPGTASISGPKTATLKKKGVTSSGGNSRQSSVEDANALAGAGGAGGTAGRAAGQSPLNPRRGVSGGSGLVSIGGAVASMNATQGLGVRASSPTQGRRKILGGLRKSGGGGRDA
ncbi:hypothetical protein IAT38_002795 [Cryptococcus sp. DSM 104549]